LHADSPCSPAPRPNITVEQNHRSIAGVTYLAASPANLAGNLGELSSDSFLPSDLHHTPQIKSLIEPVRDDLVRPDLIRSNAPHCVSDRTGMPQPEHATCRIQI
jgi:hypothetical protein